MTSVTIELPDEVVRRVKQRAQSRGLTLSQQVSELLQEVTGPDEDDLRANAIRRMKDLFAQVHGFRSEPRIPREELYERGSLR